MKKIVGKQRLTQVNEVADLSMSVTRELFSLSNELQNPGIRINVKPIDMMKLAQGYLFLYSKCMEHGLMPAPSDRKRFPESIH